ncbi:MAG: 4-hydroxythreonine-4-phosphate dehydrogenase PdxA [Proteobacteria bacterium]|nr:4-hydroxythreonine-4-phosphate dehydrogenase PdxA [Pseudomonadota bacterium]
MGEPAGIGGEILLNAWRALRQDGPAFFAVDDAARLEALARMIGLAVPIRRIESVAEATAPFPSALPVLHAALASPSAPGRLDPRHANAVTASIARAVHLVRAGDAAALVTNPIHKATLYRAGFGFPGHTEYLAHLAEKPQGAVMMLACDTLRVVPVSVHLPLRRAIETLTTERILYVARIVNDALRHDFGIARPRLAVAGLNPHAGEDGALGEEDRAIVLPAVTALREAGIDARGPLPPDTMFHAEARATYDAAICMYHDQALIPLKTIDFHGGVNITLGLPFVRTSPDHGTALDIAGTGHARADSLIAAIQMAATMAMSRRRAAAA